MQIVVTFLFSALLSFISTPAYAEVREGGSNVSVSIDNSANTSKNNSYSNNLSSNTNITINENTGDASVKVNNNEFTITGTVKYVSGTTLNISGQNIQFDPSKLSTPSVGQKVTIKGTVASNGTLTATSISTDNSSSSVLGTNIKNNPSTPHPSNSYKPTAAPSSTISPSASSTPLPTLKPFNLLEQLKEVFKQIFSIFKIK